jgi:type IV secretory pathway VirB4 component
MKRKEFIKPFIQIKEELPGLSVIYSGTGSMSIIMRIYNQSPQYSADPENYESYHHLFGQIIKLLGEGYTLQKTDIIASRRYSRDLSDIPDYLSRKYFEHFENRTYKEITTYLTITREPAKGNLLSFDSEALKEFLEKTKKVVDTIRNQKITCKPLSLKQVEALHNRYLAFNFSDKNFAIGNLSCDEKGVYYEERSLKSISLIDIDEINLPSSVTTFTVSQDIGKTFPVDNLSFLLTVAADTILYNQVVRIPDQRKLKSSLELKKKRHSSMPDPANELSVADINDMFIDIAQNNELLVYAHYNIIVCDKKDRIEKAVNTVENSLFSAGIIPGKNTYNQFELFRAAIPGNAEELQDYDMFLTSRPAAICFFFKERLPESEKSDYLLWFTDRQGIPIGIDTSQLPIFTGRISNRNRFILGPSGSGKSFFTNSYAKQCKELGADIVLVDNILPEGQTIRHYNFENTL